MDEALKKRIFELSERSFLSGTYLSSQFLTEAEQNEILREKLPLAPDFCGGFSDSERKIAFFGNADLCGYEEKPPIICLKIEPLLQKFADALTHRDFLGAILSLGIKREVIGDIIVRDNIGYLFCLDTIAKFIESELCEIKHTSVKVSEVESLPESAAVSFENKEIIAASNRLDAVIGAVFGLSRSQSRELIEREKVSIKGAVCTNGAKEIQDGDKISVRGFGKFIFDGYLRDTKRGKERFCVKIFK